MVTLYYVTLHKDRRWRLTTDNFFYVPRPAKIDSNVLMSDYTSKSAPMHRGDYGYSKFIYASDGDRIRIICPIHGEFEHRASSRVFSRGCHKCAATKSRGINYSEFYTQAKALHENRYIYFASRYKYPDPVAIYCPLHGFFKMLPQLHLRGHGCAECEKNYAPIVQKIIKYLQANRIIYKTEFILRLGDDSSFAEKYDIYLPEYHAAIQFDDINDFDEIVIAGLDPAKQLVTNTLPCQLMLSPAARVKDTLAQYNAMPMLRVSFSDEMRLEYYLDRFISMLAAVRKSIAAYEIIDDSITAAAAAPNDIAFRELTNIIYAKYGDVEPIAENNPTADRALSLVFNIYSSDFCGYYGCDYTIV